MPPGPPPGSLTCAGTKVGGGAGLAAPDHRPHAALGTGPEGPAATPGRTPYFQRNPLCRGSQSDWQRLTLGAQGWVGQGLQACQWPENQTFPGAEGVKGWWPHRELVNRAGLWLLSWGGQALVEGIHEGSPVVRRQDTDPKGEEGVGGWGSPSGRRGPCGSV